MKRVIPLTTPLNTSFGKIRKIHCSWILQKKEYEYLPYSKNELYPGTTIGEIKLECSEDKILPIKILTPYNIKDVIIHPLNGENTAIIIKQKILNHLCKCDICLRYIIIHELTHLMYQFQFPKPIEFQGFGKKIMDLVYHYLTDSLIDRWNVQNLNYQIYDPVVYIPHIFNMKKKYFVTTTRENFFEYYVYVAKFASHSESWKNNLYQHAYIFPTMLRDKYHKLLDALSGDYTGPDFPVYELVRDIAELILCPNKKEIMKNELKRRFLTLSEIGATLFKERNIKTLIQQLWSIQNINIFQLRNSFFDWNRTFKRILDISSDELKYIDDLLSEPLETNKFILTYFLQNEVEE